MKNRLIFAHHPPVRGEAVENHGFHEPSERFDGFARETSDSTRPFADRSPRDANLEPDLRLGPLHLVSRIGNTEAERDGSPVDVGERLGPHRTELTEQSIDLADFAEREKIDDERQVSVQSSARLVEVDVDADVLRSVRMMKKEVRAASGITLPPTFELMARGLLKAGQLPALFLHARANRIDERFQREDGFLREVVAHTSARDGRSMLTPFPTPS